MKRFLLLLLALPMSVIAVEPAKRELISRLLEVTNAKQTLETLQKQNVALVRQTVDAQNAKTQFANNPIMRRLIDRVMTKYEAYMQERMGWARWEPRYVAWYDESFTTPQLKETLAFLTSDAGNAWIVFQRQAAMRMQASAVEASQDQEAKIKQLMDETIAEVKTEVDSENGAKTTTEPASADEQKKE
jgi:hypothetical protein